MKTPELIGITTTPSTPIPVEAFGTPGVRSVLHVVPQFEDGRGTQGEVFRDASERQFVISARLSKGPSIPGDIKGDFTEKDGESYLTAPDAGLLKVDAELGSFEVRKNDVGELSFIQLHCTAPNENRARTRFINSVYPVLDHLSYVHNAALFVTMIRVVDAAHQSTHIECASPYRRQDIKQPIRVRFDEMKPVYSMYREAKNSDSDFYRFLCYYKIMEGLLGKMRAAAFTRARDAGTILTIGRDLVPDDRDLAPELKPYVGKSIKTFFDNLLTGKFRNAMAHFQTDAGILHVSSSAELQAYADIAFASDLCVRVLIATHESILSQLS